MPNTRDMGISAANVEDTPAPPKNDSQGNKFELPESGITYVGDWRTPISHWWIDSDKETKLYNAKNNNTKLPIESEEIDYWNRMKK